MGGLGLGIPVHNQFDIPQKDHTTIKLTEKTRNLLRNMNSLMHWLKLLSDPKIHLHNGYKLYSFSTIISGYRWSERWELPFQLFGPLAFLAAVHKRTAFYSNARCKEEGAMFHVTFALSSIKQNMQAELFSRPCAACLAAPWFQKSPQRTRSLESVSTRWMCSCLHRARTGITGLLTLHLESHLNKNKSCHLTILG